MSRADIAVGAWMAHAELARSLWDEGLLASAIAKRVGHGATKNSIVGYAHRHAWPPRPSPIAVNGLRPAAARPRKPYLTKAERAQKQKPGRPRKAPAASTAAPEPRQPAPPPEPTHIRGCQWIEGDGRPWTMCGAPVVPGRPYCAAHHSRAYNRHPRMAEAA